MASVLLPNYWERIDSVSPSQASFGPDGGSASMEFIVSRGNIGYVLADILGSAIINANGSLSRVLPLAHPEYNWLYASKITSLQGIGAAGAYDAQNSTLSLQDDVDRKLPSFLAVYEKYKIGVQFETRPYLVLSDAQTWQYAAPRSHYDTQGFQQMFMDYGEYRRFSKMVRTPTAEFLASNNGTFFFQSPDLPGGLAQATSATTGAGPQIVVMKSKVVVTWFFVPYRMVTSINIRQASGRINWHSEAGQAGAFFGFEQGALLFEGIEIAEYPGPFPTSLVNFGVPPGSDLIDASIYNNKYCDVSFIFSEFTVPTEMQARGPINNLGIFGAIYEHHNRLPHVGLMKYLYVCNNFQAATGLPIYWSYNMKKLFRFDA